MMIIAMTIEDSVSKLDCYWFKETIYTLIYGVQMLIVIPY